MPEPQSDYSYRTDPAVPAFADERPVLVFDGLCVLCSQGAQWVLRRDRAGRFRFTTAQSPLGQALFIHYGMDPNAYESVLLIEAGRLYVRSDVAVRVGKTLGGVWSTAVLLKASPLAWRDGAYDWLARRRFDLFGRRPVCFRPEPGWAERFLE
jgi:predicted DCC family thiol-disulfide oxidoreductase YuxK